MKSIDDLKKALKPDQYGRVTLANVAAVVELHRITIHRRVKNGTFPPPLEGLTRVMWMLEDIVTYWELFGPRPWNPWQPRM
ncbi:hypothetical protein E2493_16690 [Sphingomonas parva]|uniref:AlpA family phage regulatory protein n=1 Tax=Sphingomonas parva TaxID=2555898 RepID=A0A4Y8ZPV1_9SPHN|nr:hypothetical protein [Sphingomonas parva]TFI57145.1 hypothetical protein E2493_16690 [Sphingomonas parva]